MKTTLSSLLAVLLTSAAMAAPSISPSDISNDALKDIATERQKASLDAHESAKAKAKKERDEKIQKDIEDTKRNDAGMKRTIQRNHLNSMLPPCDREPDSPREPQDYHIRY